MNLAGVLQATLFITIVAALVKPVGGYLAAVFSGRSTFLDAPLRPLEWMVYWLAGINPAAEMTGKAYVLSFLLFTLAGTLLLYMLLRVQFLLPWFFPDSQVTAMTPALAANVAVSFSTTTTWQAYVGETTITYFSQLVGLAPQNFLAGAAGLAVGAAFIRGLARSDMETPTLGNFWVDLTRSILWVLLPISLVASLVLVWQGVPMTFAPYAHATTLEGREQVIAWGPVAAFEIIKNLGTNGGGFFNVNAAHPFENPTPLTNVIHLLAIAVLPAAFTSTFGRMVGLFLAGLMVRRTPEYLGKRLGPRELKLITLYTVAAPMAVLALAGLAVVTGAGLAGLTANDGPRGFTEILFAYTSSFANNGQNFAGLSANSPFYNVTTIVAMLAGRFALAIPALFLAAALARQPRRALGLGTLRTDSLTFAGLLIGTIVIVSGLSYFQAVALGPIVEHLKFVTL